MACGSKKCWCICAIATCAILVLVIISIVIAVVIAMKHAPKFRVTLQVTNASLTKFDFSNNNTFLDYNLFLTLNLQNRESHRYSYEQLAAAAVFQNQTLNDTPVNVSKPFDLGAKANVSFPTLFSGNRSSALGSFNLSNVSRVFDIVLKVNSSSSPIKEYMVKWVYTCNLKVPLLNSNGASSGDDPSFQTTKCEGKYDSKTKK